MKSRSFLTLILSLILVPWVCAEQQEKPDKQPAIQSQSRLKENDGSEQPEANKSRDYSAEAELQENENEAGQYLARFRLGRLPVGEEVYLSLKIKNPLDKEIRFSGVPNQCACSDFKTDKYLFQKKGEVNATFRMKVGGSTDSSSASRTIQLVRGEKQVAQIYLDYELEGQLTFTEFIRIISFDSDGQTRTIDMPFRITDPVQIDRLQAAASDNLSGLEFEVLPAAGGGILKVSASDSILKNGKVRGEIYLKDQDSEKQAVIYLSIKSAKRAEISPDVISFKNDGAGLSASATICLTGNKAGGDKSESPLPEVSCTYDGRAVAVEVSRLSSELLRIKLRVDEEGKSKMAGSKENNSNSAALNWKIVNGENKTSLISPFIVE